MRLCHRIIQILLDSRINLVFIFIIINVYNKNIKQQIFCNRPTICSFTKIRMTSGRQQRCPFFCLITCVLPLSCVDVCVWVLLFYVLFFARFSLTASYSSFFFSSSSSFVRHGIVVLFTVVFIIINILYSSTYFCPCLFFLFPFYNIYYTMWKKKQRNFMSRILIETKALEWFI